MIQVQRGPTDYLWSVHFRGKSGYGRVTGEPFSFCAVIGGRSDKWRWERKFLKAMSIGDGQVSVRLEARIEPYLLDIREGETRGYYCLYPDVSMSPQLQEIGELLLGALIDARAWRELVSKPNPIFEGALGIASRIVEPEEGKPPGATLEEREELFKWIAGALRAVPVQAPKPNRRKPAEKAVEKPKPEIQIESRAWVRKIDWDKL